MRKDFGAKPWLYPQQVFIIGTYNKDGTPNAMNAAWGGVGDTAQVFICISPGHRTTENILREKEFTVSMGTLDQMTACDYVGLVSGKNDPKKMERTGWHFSKANNVNAPVISELPLTLECRLMSYNPEYGHLFGDIVNLSADESILTDGKIDPDKLKPLSYDCANKEYRVIGEKVGKAFSIGNELKK